MLGLYAFNKEYLTSFDVSKRKIEPYAIVVHTTGSGIVQKAFNKKIKDPIGVAEYACKFYAQKNNVSTHLLIGWDGEVYQLAPLDMDCWHSGWGQETRDKYKDGTWKEWSHPIGQPLIKRAPSNGYKPWEEQHKGLDSPLSLLSPRAFSPNDGTISVDFLAQPGGNEVTQLQIDSFRLVHSTVSDLLDTKLKVLRHADVDPIHRGSVLQSGKIVCKLWDPLVSLKDIQ